MEVRRTEWDPVPGHDLPVLAVSCTPPDESWGENVSPQSPQGPDDTSREADARKCEERCE